MKTQPTTRNLQSNGIQNAVSFGIKKDGFAHIFNVLRNQLYSDKYKAVLREYSTNGVDAHIEAGIPERPIEVTLPTLLSPLLKIRDFGPALTEKEVHEIYAFYGESTKRNTNSQTGMLGIGSKSAFAYGDNFVITSFVDGLKHTYNAFIDPSQVGQIAKLNEEESDEENGVEISIPVKEDDVDTFIETAKEIFQYFKVRPIIKGQRVEFDDERTVVFEGNDWKWRKNSEGYGYYGHRNGTGDAIVVMGNIGYPVDFDSLNYKGEDVGELENICKDNLLLEIPIGELEISASREQLQYTDHTIKNIIAKFRSVRDAMIAKIKKEFDGCKTVFEAKCLVGTMDDMTSGLYQFRELINKNIVVKGQKIESDSFSATRMEDEEVVIRHFVKTQRSQKLKLDWTSIINCKKETLIIENDEQASRGLMNRLLALELEEERKVYLVTYKDAKAKKKFSKETGFDCPNIRKFSELPSRKLNEFEGYGRVASVGGSWEKTKDSKHSSNVFELRWDKVGSWSNKASDFWTKKLVDFDKKDGVYMIIDRFQPELGHNSKVSWRINDLARWGCIKDLLIHFGIDLPEVVGVKKGSRSKVESKDGWTNIYAWVLDQIDSKVKNLKQDIANHNAIKDSSKDHNWNVQSDNKWLKKLRSEVSLKDSEFLAFFEARDNMTKNLGKKVVKGKKASLTFDKVQEVVQNDLGMKIDLDGIDPTHDLVSMAESVSEKYSMLKHTDYGFWGYRADEDKIQDVANYINIVDICNVKNNS